ncbi:MAG: hypothetical protein N2748_05985 [candidate division WOR-3 bacterium]|nr:hypothetical protein [candidate division WOR-3 bacterium]
MNILIAFYSKTGNTKIVAEAIAENFKRLSLNNALTVSVEEIIDMKNRSGILGWLKAGRDAIRKKLTTIAEPKFNPINFEIVILGTPIWAGMPSPAIRTYLSKYCSQLKKIAFFATSKYQNIKILDELSKLCQPTPLISYLNITEKELKALKSKAGTFTEVTQKKIQDFSQKVLWNR